MEKINNDGTDKDGNGRKIGKPKPSAGGFSEQELRNGTRRLGNAPVTESPKGERWKP